MLSKQFEKAKKKPQPVDPRFKNLQPPKDNEDLLTTKSQLLKGMHDAVK